MIINLKELSDKNIESSTTSTKMRLSDNASSMVFQMFTKNVYSNPIGTVVREITSNCFDSHIEAKIKAPVVIRKFTDTQTNTEYISFFDFGVGMSPDRVYNIYGVYFESTKRIDNEQIGGFGIGAKSVLAYKRVTGQGVGEYDNSFYVITVFDNIKYYYMVYEGQDSPVISLLHEEATDEGNGTEIRIPVLAKDVAQFSKEMVRQLYYFEDIIFEGFEKEWKYGDILTNDYQIMRAKTFLFRGSDYGDYMHICLGRVAYPIDYATLGLDAGEYRLPVALKLEVGDINVVVSRESVDYSEGTIKMLKAKLIETKKEVVEMLMKQYEDITTLAQYFDVKSNFGNLYFENGKSMYVGNLIKQSDVTFTNFAYQFMKIPNDKQLFRLFFDVKAFGKKQKKSRYHSSNEFEGGYKELKDSTNILSIEGDFNRKVLKQAYLKDQYELYHIISRRNIVSRNIVSEINELFGTNVMTAVDATGKVDPFIKTIHDMQDEYFEIVQKYAEDYDDLVVPEDFIAERKARRKMITEEMRKMTISMKFVHQHGRGERITLSDLFDYRMPIFYGTQDDSNALDEAYRLYELLFDEKLIATRFNSRKNKFEHSYDSREKGGIMFIQLAQGNVKYMQYCQNAMHIDNFFWKMLHRKEGVIRQYFQVYQLVEKYNNLPSLCQDEDFGKVDKAWGKHIKKLNAYIKSIPEAAKDSSIGHWKGTLSRYFKGLYNIEMDKEQIKYMKMIDELRFMYDVNKPTIRYIQMPYGFEHADADLINLLQKVMTL
jgi:hypothetical protein